MNSAIEVEGLSKSYGMRQVLNRLTFQIEKGEIFALLGTNGAGKTTALECIEGIRKFESGHIAIHGKIGIQLQSASLPSHIKALEAVKLFCRWKRASIDHEMLHALDIDRIAQKQYAALSTGQKRRLQLALALIGDPDILFLDEPTAGLDVQGRNALHGQIRTLKAKGKTIVLASHDLTEVQALCDRMAILKNGSLVFVGTLAELNARTGGHSMVRITTSQGQERISADHLRDPLLALLETYRQKQIEVLDIQVERKTLEEHFMELVKGNPK